MDKVKTGPVFQCILLLMASLLGALAFIFPSIAFIWIFIGWDYVTSYAPVLALSIGSTVAMASRFKDPEFPVTGRHVVIVFYGCLMLLYLVYGIFYSSVPSELIKPQAPEIVMTEREREAFERRQECKRIKRQYMEGAMDNFEGRSSQYDDLVAPEYCR